MINKRYNNESQPLNTIQSFVLTRSNEIRGSRELHDNSRATMILAYPYSFLFCSVLVNYDLRLWYEARVNRLRMYLNMHCKYFSLEQIRGLPASIDSKEDLCDILSRIISHVTIYHASVNYVVTDYPEYIPNQPTKLYDDTRVKDGEFSVFRLPNRLTSAVSKTFQTHFNKIIVSPPFPSQFQFGLRSTISIRETVFHRDIQTPENRVENTTAAEYF